MKSNHVIILAVCAMLLVGCAFGGVGHYNPDEYNIECVEVRAIKMNPRRDLTDTIYFVDGRDVGVNEGGFYKIGKKYLVISSKSHRNYLIPYEQIYRDIHFPPPPPTECK